MTITVNGATNTLTAASGLAIAGNTAVTGTLSATGASTLASIASSYSGAVSSFTRTGLNGAGAGVQVLTVGTDHRTNGDGILLPFNMLNASSTTRNYGGIKTTIVSSTAGNEFGSMAFGLTAAGTYNDVLTLTGSLITTGAASIVSVTDVTDATSTTAASLKTAGGLAVAKKTYCGDNIVMASGKGIDFSATSDGSGTTTSEVLSDYEEGTWTPTVVGLSTAGVGTYSAQVGLYTKVGRKVTANLYIAISAHTGTGNIEFGGLPFVSKGGANYFNAAAIGFLDGLSLTAGNVATAYVGAGVSTITLQQTPSGGGASASVPMDTVFSIILSVTYFTA